ncbi:MAG TPA: 1-(5-phosphoribosyl)-5-[(5-phosphoribosylamino)methylideneamino]imidazole-4-carboxamide isomerase [Actinomycetota bacterium]|nr:1-(5-phosphoribosyl)-5-[(5-phosphoribosylamino)methylideneamino]imidazole-4-carboxamide isomerase [Actinomycetota bacterium]
MIVIPAIDLRGGRVVRLFRGDFRHQTSYEDDPVEVARRFEAEGARRLHVVDLDAAADEGSNRDVVREICRTVAIPVQLGGGIRTLDALERALEDGAARAILGTAAALDAGFVAEAVERAGDRAVVGVDVRDGHVMTHAWREEGPRLEDAIAALTGAGATRFIVTSIARDGTMDGPDLPLYERVVQLTDVPVIASGGVRVAEDVWALRDLGLEACVVGKAMYSGTLRLREVVRG